MERKLLDGEDSVIVWRVGTNATLSEAVNSKVSFLKISDSKKKALWIRSGDMHKC